MLFVCVLLSLLILRDLIVLIPEHCLSIYFVHNGNSDLFSYFVGTKEEFTFRKSYVTVMKVCKNHNIIKIYFSVCSKNVHELS